MNMREKIARAIAKKLRVPDYVIPDPYWFDQYLSLADAALEAMREPTDEMIEAGQRHSMNGGPKDRWEAMIDAAREGK